MKNPTDVECQILDFMSRRGAVHVYSIPVHWRKHVHRMVDPDRGGSLWIERHDIVLVRATDAGRAIAAAYRHGRASIPKPSDDAVESTRQEHP